MRKMEEQNASRNVGKSRAPEGSSSPSTQTPHSSRADEVQKERDNMMIAIVQAAVSEFWSLHACCRGRIVGVMRMGLEEDSRVLV